MACHGVLPDGLVDELRVLVSAGNTVRSARQTLTGMGFDLSRLTDVDLVELVLSDKEGECKDAEGQDSRGVPTC